LGRGKEPVEIFFDAVPCGRRPVIGAALPGPTAMTPALESKGMTRWRVSYKLQLELKKEEDSQTRGKRSQWLQRLV
jgi:hypothetical protein